VPPAIRTTGFDLEFPVAELRANPHNVNQGDIGAITESMDELGFYGAVLAVRTDEGPMILAGAHRWQTARQQGMTAIPVLWTDYEPEEWDRVMLSDNRTARLGFDDNAALSGLLEELAGRDALRGTGYDAEDLDELLRDLSRPLDSAPQMGEVRYRVIVHCRDEATQAELLARLAAEGLNVQAVSV
jgi:ParB-like chromosome segregation protein Spo0J